MYILKKYLEYFIGFLPLTRRSIGSLGASDLGPVGSERAVHRRHLGPKGNGEKALGREGGKKMHMSLMNDTVLKNLPQIIHAYSERA